MKIILDTNILIREDYFLSASMQKFLKAANFLKMSVYLPEVVYDELLANAKCEIDKQSKIFKEANKKLTNLTGKEISETDYVTQTDSKKAFSDYERQLENTLKLHNVKILNYPSISPKKIVQASYTGKMPFRSPEKGYKDYLIWQTMRELIEKNHDEKFVFLTDNIQDFCDKKLDPLSLHPDLLNQLDGVNGVEIRVFKNLGEFFDEELGSQLQGEDPRNIPNDVLKKMKDIAESLLMFYPAEGFEGVPLKDVHIVYTDNIRLGEPTAKAFGSDEILVTFSGAVDAEIEGYISKSDYRSYEDDYTSKHKSNSKIFISDPDWNDQMMAASVCSKLQFEIELIIDKGEREIVSEEINFPAEISHFH